MVPILMATLTCLRTRLLLVLLLYNVIGVLCKLLEATTAGTHGQDDLFVYKIAIVIGIVIIVQRDWCYSRPLQQVLMATMTCNCTSGPSRLGSSVIWYGMIWYGMVWYGLGSSVI